MGFDPFTDRVEVRVVQGWREEGHNLSLVRGLRRKRTSFLPDVGRKGRLSDRTRVGLEPPKGVRVLLEVGTEEG